VRRRLLTILFLPALLSGAVGGCSSGGGKKAAAPTTATTAWNAPGAAGAGASSTTVPPGVTVRAHEYGFDAPAEVEGGVVRLTLQNDGKLKHEAVIVEAGDTPLDRLKQDLEPVVKGDGGPVPAYLHFRGGVSLVPGGTSSSASLTVPAGKYVLVCTLTDADSQDATTSTTTTTTTATAQSRADAARFHFDRGMAVPFEVKTANAAVMPGTDGTVVARDWAFDLPPLAPGARTLMFRNDGQQDHSLGLAEFDDGVDAATAKGAFDQFLAADTAGRPPPEGLPAPADVTFAGPLSAGGQATFTVELKPNRTYVFACYMADRSGGPRHAGGKGMVAYVTTPAA
jgi:uncharacterized cupredoxin-like copper-binding protein